MWALHWCHCHPPQPPYQVPSLELTHPEACLHSPHTRCSICQGGFLTYLSLFLFLLDVPLPKASSHCKCWCGYSQGTGKHLPDLLCDSASSRPSGSLKPALPLPASWTYSLCQDSKPSPIREGWWKDVPLGMSRRGAACQGSRTAANLQGCTRHALPYWTAGSKTPHQLDCYLMHF